MVVVLVRIGTCRRGTWCIPDLRAHGTWRLRFQIQFRTRPRKTSQVQRGNDLALFWSSREGAPDARGRRVGVQEGRDGVVLDLPVKTRGPTKLEEGSGHGRARAPATGRNKGWRGEEGV